jgi:hypothetical protein
VSTIFTLEDQVTVTMNEIIAYIESELARVALNVGNGYEERDIDLAAEAARRILDALEAGQAYADAFRAWHGIGQRQDCSKESMERFKKTRNAALAAYPGGES